MIFVAFLDLYFRFYTCRVFFFSHSFFSFILLINFLRFSFQQRIFQFLLPLLPLILLSLHRLRFAGHILRMDENRLLRRTFIAHMNSLKSRDRSILYYFIKVCARICLRCSML